MVNIFVTITVPRQNRDKILALLGDLSYASQGEKGCIHYQYYLHPEDPEQLVIVERWESPEALSAHEKTSHFKTLLPQVSDLASEVNINKL